MWLLIWGGWGGWHKLRCVCIYAYMCYETVSSAVAQGLRWFMLSWCDFTTCGVVEAPFSSVKTSLFTWVLLQMNCVKALILIKSVQRLLQHSADVEWTPLTLVDSQHGVTSFVQQWNSTFSTGHRFWHAHAPPPQQRWGTCCKAFANLTPTKCVCFCVSSDMRQLPKE